MTFDVIYTIDALNEDGVEDCIPKIVRDLLEKTEEGVTEYDYLIRDKYNDPDEVEFSEEGHYKFYGEMTKEQLKELCEEIYVGFDGEGSMLGFHGLTPSLNFSERDCDEFVQGLCITPYPNERIRPPQSPEEEEEQWERIKEACINVFDYRR